MKKILLGTTAIVALTAITSEALAADPISLSLGGFQKFYVGIANDTDAENEYMDFGMQHDSEVYFKGST
ncbi:MAG: porin, partial [Rhodospirillaceae bacterium]|nr:porin [Rhodospirillaceae bacterium]